MTKERLIIIILLSINSIVLLWLAYKISKLDTIICVQSDIIRNVSDEYNHDSVYNIAQHYLDVIDLDTNYLNSKSYMY